MNRQRLSIILSSALVVLVSACAWPGRQDAGKSVVVKDRVVTQDLMVGAQTVSIQSDVQGDVAAAGADVTITGPVSGYVMSAGRNVTLSGTIGNDLWAAGANVDVNNRVGDNVMAAGRNVYLHPNTVVGRDAHLAGRLVVAEGRIDHDLRIAASTAEIGANVGGTVVVHAMKVTVRPGAVISGDLVVSASQPPDVSPQARVDGAVRFTKTDTRSAWMTRVWFWVLAFVGLLILGAVAFALAPTWAARVEGEMRTRAGASVLTGIIVLIVTPIVIGLLAMTVVGLPLALVLLAFYAAALLLSCVVVSRRFGSWLLGRGHGSPSRWAGLILGLVLVTLGLVLPWICWVVAVVVAVMGMGALTLERRTSRQITAPSPST